MKKNLFTTVFSVLLIVLSALSCSLQASAGKGQSSDYPENEWNFVDASMDISQGISDEATGALGRIQRNGCLRVAVRSDLAPYVYNDPDKNAEDALTGADISLARRIAERMGVKLEVLQLDSTQILPSLTEEQCDLSISAIAYTPNRALNYSLSKGYYYPEKEPDIGFVVHKDNQGRIAGLDDMEERVVVTQSNSLAETVGVELLKDYLEFRRVFSVQGVYEAVENKTADVGIVDVDITRIYLENHPDCELCLIEDLTFSPEKQYQGCRVSAKKGETGLIAFVNGVIDEILESGEYERWIEEAGT